ncbi:hypothetical protein LEP1GSC203_3088 [Leptospira terpstrae serovar Hualin str. LT 11-33 = ATCC 700639]|uniref:Uncharacterized protein n=1 Tax=Leptospira terpstrae serovar Hualin str. LT 11-33 = ATCC 700639 TaxID=1257025 RepID=N1VVP3_9LEPT|nr:hypothetical protein LEP1GSC203_3088 [Leptospira terpstrae serovar Hualin str. LT 11-33 = ATCC 700639]
MTEEESIWNCKDFTAPNFDLSFCLPTTLIESNLPLTPVFSVNLNAVHSNEVCDESYS